MQFRLSKFISYLFQPLLMPFYCISIIFSLNSFMVYNLSFKSRLLILSLIFIITFVLPVCTFLFLYFRKIISSIEMHDRKERTLPFLITSIYLYITFYLLQQFLLPAFVYLTLLGGIVSVLATLLINLFWKISAHMVGIGGLLGLIMGISFRYSLDFLALICILFFIAGLIGYARLYLSSHKPAQVYSGFLLGFLSLFFLVVLI